MVQEGAIGRLQEMLESGVSANVADDNGVTPLYLSVVANNLPAAKLLVREGGADPDTRIGDQWTALSKASHKGYLHIVKFLVLEGGATVDLKSGLGYAPMYVGALANRVDVVEWLVTYGNASVDMENGPDGWSALKIASYKGNVETVRYLVLSAGATVDLKNDDGFTSLYSAVQTDHLAVAKVLVESGNASVDMRNGPEGLTVLMLASILGHAEMVQYCLERGASVDLKDYVGYTSLFNAVTRNHLEVTRVLVAEGNASVDATNGPDGSTALKKASADGSLEVARFLLGVGATVDLKDSEGNTPLYEAARKNHSDIVRLLVVEGNAQVDAPNGPDRWTALKAASMEGNLDVVSVLLHEGEAMVDLKDGKGLTPLYEATRANHLDVVEALVDKGASVDARNGEAGHTALTVASHLGHAGIVRFLVQEAGGSVDLRDGNGLALLYLASAYGHLEAVEVLVQVGNASLDATNGQEGLTALMRASVEGHVLIVGFLVRSGADVDSQDAEGFTALYEAVRSNHLEVVKVLVEEGSASLNVRSGPEGLTPLEKAKADGHEDIARYLSGKT